MDDYLAVALEPRPNDEQWETDIARTDENSVDVEFLPFVVAVATLTGAISYLNRTARSYLGVATPRSTRWDLLAHPNDRRLLVRELNRARRGRRQEPVECRLRHASGDYRWFSLKLSLRRNARGAISDIVVAGVDVHKWVLGNFALENRAELRSRMLDASVDCIKIIDTDGALRHMNRSGHLALGVPLECAEYGMRWLELLPPEIRKNGRSAWRARERTPASPARASSPASRRNIGTIS